MTETLTLTDRFVRLYGRGWKPGVVVDDVPAFEAAGGVVRDGAHGGMWAVVEGGRAYPVVCGDIVMLDSEDGPVTGRCGLAASSETGACVGHR